MKLFIKTLTPVHIGTGRELEKFEYQVKNNLFSRINFDRLTNLLIKKYPDTFRSWLNKISNEENISSLISLDSIRRNVAGQGKIDNELNESINYVLNCDFNPSNKIRECFKSGNNELLIPGSSIKGMIRTSLFYSAISRLDQSRSSKYFQNKIIEINNFKNNKELKDAKKRKNDLKDKFDREIEELIFYCGVLRDGTKNYSDEKFDLMKLISVSDTSCLDPKLRGSIADVKMFKFGKKENPKNLICAEVINQNSQLEFNISVNSKFIEKAKSELNNNSSKFGKNDWIDFKARFNHLFNVDLDKLEESDIEEKIVQHVVECIDKFGKEIFKREKKWIDSLSSKENKNQLNAFYSSSPEHFIKVGYASGFPGTTLFLWTLEFKTEMQKILDFFQIGYHRTAKKNANIDEFPITRRYHNANSELSALGWIQLSKEEFNMDEDTMEGTEIRRSAIIEKQEGWVEAEIVQIAKKPYKIKILEGEMKDNELNFQYGNIEDLEIGKKLYVAITINKKQKLDSKTQFKGFIKS